MRNTVILALLLLAAAPAAAQLSCGDTIGKGQRVTLTANVGPCDNDDAAALIVDGGQLDLGGFTVSCADTDGDLDLPQGVVLFGKKSKVRNGTVTGCSNGVGLGGQGKHLVQAITVSGSADDGIDVASAKNKVLGNSVSGSGSDGIYVRTDKNRVADNTVSGSVEDGIDIIGDADKNRLSDNRCDANGDAGIEVGGTKNVVKNTTASNNAQEGIDLGEDGKNKVVGGTLQGNGEADIEGCTGNKVRNVTFTTASPDCQ
jgi:parallel beta-helix repeat protein